MKKLLVILCLCSLLLAFAGCSGTAPVATETSTATQETTTESIETPPESTETTAESMETTPESTTETTLETTAKPTPTPIVTKGDAIEDVGDADDIVIRGDKIQISDRYCIHNPALLLPARCNDPAGMSGSQLPRVHFRALLFQPPASAAGKCVLLHGNH